MTQNINIQRQEGEAKQSPIQHQDLCWGMGGEGSGMGGREEEEGGVGRSSLVCLHFLPK